MRQHVSRASQLQAERSPAIRGWHCVSGRAAASRRAGSFASNSRSDSVLPGCRASSRGKAPGKTPDRTTRLDSHSRLTSKHELVLRGRR
jgi:hypothetical protein